MDSPGAVLNGCYVYGISAWNLKLDGADQKNLIVGKKHDAVFTVDNLEVAQFIYLILNNQKIRDVITTIGQKAVLILGRFSPPKRKDVLDGNRIPFVTILQDGEPPFSMFKDLTAYDWVLQPVITYGTRQSIVAGLEAAVIGPALRKHVELVNRKAEALRTKPIEELMSEIAATPRGAP